MVIPRMFFDGLKERGLVDQSIVIITGDHAFPMGQHGITSLENGFYEESYRMPFFLVVPKASPRRLPGAFSQVDIMPTMFDLLNHRVTNTMFMGVSIFAEKKDRPVLQIQPYAKQIGVVKYPIKYRYSVKENKSMCIIWKGMRLKPTILLMPLMLKHWQHLDAKLARCWPLKNIMSSFVRP